MMINLTDLSARYLFSDYIESEQVLYRQARMVTQKTDPPLIFSLDGDLIDEPPISFLCLLNKLNVIVGADFDKQ